MSHSRKEVELFCQDTSFHCMNHPACNMAKTVANHPATDRTAGQHLQNYTSSASKSTVNNLGDREESLKLKEEELNNKLKTIARKKEDIERLVRLRDKEFKTREKRIERNEEALKKAESVLRMCERCRGEKYRLDNGTEKSAASPLLDEDHNGHFLTSYSHLD